MILIGGIVIAFVVLGTIVAFNGLVHTEELSSSETGQSMAQVETTASELENGVQGFGYSYVEEHEDGFEGRLGEEDFADQFYDEDEWESALNEEFLPVFQNMTTERTPHTLRVTDVSGSVSISAIDGESLPGRSGTEEEVLNRTGSHGYLFEFEASGFDRGAGNNEAFTIETPDGDEFEFVVDQGQEEIRHPNGVCDVQDRIDGVDFMSGEVDTRSGPDSCDFEVLERGMEIERVEVTERSSEIDYDLIGVGSVQEGAGAEEFPWVAEITYTYDSNEVATERTIEVDLYSDLL
ncbi:hypothetical protein [Natrarchaeobius chitinivorans]|nr:hypothetical protein [Natrarchaeobius chitinivorans]